MLVYMSLLLLLLVVLNLTFGIIRHEFSEEAHVDRPIQKSSEKLSFMFALFYYNISMGFEQMCSHFYDYCYVKANVIDFIVATVVAVNDDDDGLLCVNFLFFSTVFQSFILS